MTEFDLADARPGDIIQIVTPSSTWWFTLTTGSIVRRANVQGVFIMTDSRKFGQVRRAPHNLTIDRMIYFGEEIDLGNGGHTGPVQSIKLNGNSVV